MIKHCTCISGLTEIVNGLHAHDAPYKLALYDSTAALGPRTARYTTKGEIRGGGYPPGGLLLTGRQVREQGQSIVLTWENPSLQNVTITASGGLIYKDLEHKPALFAIRFKEETMSRDGPFVVLLPTLEDGGLMAWQW